MKPKVAGIDILKFIAIAAVVGIHVLSSFRLISYGTTPADRIYLGLDQFFRFCVPLFVAASGLTLARSFSQNSSLSVFLRKRLLRILPLYFFWTAVIYLIVHLSPYWSQFVDSYRPWEIIFLGKADYQLYFVPMIFQLYLLFPILFFLVKKFSWFFLVAIFVLQVWIFQRVDTINQFSFLHTGTLSDQEQYIFFFTWLFYFVLGIFIGLKSLKTNLWIFIPSLLAALIFWQISFSDVVAHLAAGENLIWVTRFTRIPILLYSTAIILAVSTSLPLWERLPGIALNILRFLGRQSYLVYLAHTLALRIIYDSWQGKVDPVTTIIAIVIFIPAIYLSPGVEKAGAHITASN